MTAIDPRRAFLATRCDPGQAETALKIVRSHPFLAAVHFRPEDDEEGKAIMGSTALHYAASDGRLDLMRELIALGADVDASFADWYRTPLAWAADNARIAAIDLLLENGADPMGYDALHAAARGGPHLGEGMAVAYQEAIEHLIDAGADVNDRRNTGGKSPLDVATEVRHQAAIETLQRLGASPRS